ncbi:transcriptional repressor [Patescibacteria group bacterium]|nr:transcriptional repressor [Patescibacteria group bacterium]
MDKQLEEKLAKKGVYFTHLVKELVTTLVKANKPLSVDDVLIIFSKKKFFPYKTSLYRQLSRLAKLDIVEESVFSGIKHYCFVFEEDHHHHFECDECGYVEKISAKNCDDFVSKISRKIKKKGHKTTSHSFVLKGLCSKCA